MKPLRAAGHVVLEETPGGDARRSGYHLSEEGHAFFTSVSGHILIAEELLVGPLSEAERGTLSRLLQRLAQSGWLSHSLRQAARRGGTECVSPCHTRWSPSP